MRRWRPGFGGWWRRASRGRTRPGRFRRLRTCHWIRGLPGAGGGRHAWARGADTEYAGKELHWTAACPSWREGFAALEGVVAVVEVGKQAGVGRLPAEDSPGREGGRRVLPDDHRREEPEVRL